MGTQRQANRICAYQVNAHYSQDHADEETPDSAIQVQVGPRHGDAVRDALASLQPVLYGEAWVV